MVEIGEIPYANGGREDTRQGRKLICQRAREGRHTRWMQKRCQPVRDGIVVDHSWHRQEGQAWKEHELSPNFECMEEEALRTKPKSQDTLDLGLHDHELRQGRRRHSEESGRRKVPGAGGQGNVEMFTYHLAHPNN